MKIIRNYIILMVSFIFFAPAISHAQTEGRVTYDFEPCSEELSSFESYISEYELIDVETAAKVLFGNEQYQIDDLYVEDQFISINCNSDTAELFITQYGSLDYATENIKYTKDILLYASSNYSSGELAFMSQDAAISLCESTFSEIGISTKAYLIASYDIDAINVLASEARDGLLEWQSNGKETFIRDEWSIDDEFYYVELYQTIDAIPVTTTGYYDKKIGVPLNGTTISAIVTHNGIECIDSSYLIKLTSSFDSIKPCTQKDALDAYITEKNSLLQGVDIHLVDMYIRYVPVFIPGHNPQESFNMVPAWTLVRLVEQDNNGVVDTFLHETYCDITNGKELGR